MKKTYISPEFVAIELRCNHMIADSLGFKSGNVTDENAVLVKEENPPINDVNVWDDEW